MEDPVTLDGPIVPEEPESPDDAPTRVESGSSPTDRPSASTRSDSSSDAFVHEPETLPAKPASHDASSRFVTAFRSTARASPTETLLREEIKRTRAFSLITMPFALAVLVGLPFVGGDSTAKMILALGMSGIIAGASVLLTLIRKDDGYNLRRVLSFAAVCVFSAFAGIYFFGVFSPAAVVIPFGLYFFSVGRSAVSTLVVYVTCAATYFVLAGGIMIGVLQDRGLVRGSNLSVPERVVITGLVEVAFAATYVIARASRRALLAALDEHDRAMLGLAQREELLKEARQDLERALEAGGLGRFTDELLGPFRLGSVIGRGGMGEVYEAVHVESHDLVAVKLLHGRSLADPTFVLRFLREARIAASLECPNVVRVLEVGGLESRVPFIAMERLRGLDLADLLRQKRRLSMVKVIDLVRDVGRGLDAARSAGIVHRDIKPRNLFFAEIGRGTSIWKILDFGVSRLVDEQGTLTHGEVLGTPSYMAPEQLKTGKVDHRADLYSLGIICYRALTGRPAFAGDQIAEILYKVAHAMPLRPSAAAKLHRDVDYVLAIAIAKEPEDRFDRAKELANALDLASHGELTEEMRERGVRLERISPWTES